MVHNRPPRNHHWHLSICSTVAPWLVSRCRRNRCRASTARDRVMSEGRSVTSKLQCRNQSQVRLAVWGPVISTSLDPTKSIWLASNCNRRRFFFLFIYRCSIQAVCRSLTEPARGNEIGSSFSMFAAK
jgi:hypothetical protein